MKRLLDIFFSAAGLALLSPLLLLIALLIKMESQGPAIFMQERMGRGFVPFTLFKFRTMRDEAEGPEVTASEDPRITRLGRILRRFKLDELPQLLNVLKGDMSLVGPRPEVRKFAEMFREDYEYVLSVRPGITDYASIEYRDEEEALSRYADREEGYVREVLPEKIKLYRKYIDEMGLLLDIRLILRTLLRIVY